MSGGAVFQEALRTINRFALPSEAQRDVVVALEKGRPALPMLYQMGHDAGLAHEPLLARASALYIGFCAGNLCDDLVDGDCTYFEPAIRLAPGLQYLLQNAFIAALSAARLPSSVIGAATRELVLAAGQHQCEVRTTTWTVEIYRRIGSGIAGRQWAANLKLLWHATPLEPLADQIGLGLGEVGHIVEDVRSRDPRLWSIPAGERRAVVAWAVEEIGRLRAHALSSVELMAGSIEPILRTHLAAESVG